LANDINYRSFETISCGTVLLTNFNSQYLELGFIDEENCLMYNSIEELCFKIEKYINNDDKLLKISKNALELSKQHTYDARIQKIIKELL
jgi:spore maturation protein CgeB